jgi:hypothetical protein
MKIGNGNNLVLSGFSMGKDDDDKGFPLPEGERARVRGC